MALSQSSIFPLDPDQHRSGSESFYLPFPFMFTRSSAPSPELPPVAPPMPTIEDFRRLSINYGLGHSHPDKSSIYDPVSLADDYITRRRGRDTGIRQDHRDYLESTSHAITPRKRRTKSWQPASYRNTKKKNAPLNKDGEPVEKNQLKKKKSGKANTTKTTSTIRNFSTDLQEAFDIMQDDDDFNVRTPPPTPRLSPSLGSRPTVFVDSNLANHMQKMELDSPQTTSEQVGDNGMFNQAGDGPSRGRRFRRSGATKRGRRERKLHRRLLRAMEEMSIE